MVSFTKKTAAVACALMLTSGASYAEPADTLRIGVSTYLSGAGAVFGVPARDAAELIAANFNKDGGIKGANVELKFIDENRGVDNVVVEYKRMVESGEVDIMVIGLSSSICLAVAPVAEQLKMPTILWDCGTARLYEENKYQYVYRTSDYTPANNVAAALYMLKDMPNIKTIAGINQDYAFGRDNWAAFKGAVQAMRPDVRFVAEMFPKLGTADYSTEISKLSALRPDVVFTSLWGGDMNTFVKQAASRSMFRNSRLVTPNGQSSLEQLGKTFPQNAIVGMRGDSWAFNPAMKDNAEHTAFVKELHAKSGAYPSFPSYHMAQSLSAIEKALESKWNGEKEQIGKAVLAGWKSLELNDYTGKLKIREDNQSMESQLFGVTAPTQGQSFMTLKRLVEIPADLISPPAGTTTEAWIKTLTPAILDKISIPAN